MELALSTEENEGILGEEMIPVIKDYRNSDYDGAIEKQEAIVKVQEQGSNTTESAEVRKTKQV